MKQLEAEKVGLERGKFGLEKEEFALAKKRWSGQQLLSQTGAVAKSTPVITKKSALQVGGAGPTGAINLALPGSIPPIQPIPQ